MPCPDIDQIIELAGSSAIDLETWRHVVECRVCSANWELVRAIRMELRREVPVPERLFRRVIRTVTEAGS